jgi:hypothetical protein
MIEFGALTKLDWVLVEVIITIMALALGGGSLLAHIWHTSLNTGGI